MHYYQQYNIYMICTNITKHVSSYGVPIRLCTWNGHEFDPSFWLFIFKILFFNFIMGSILVNLDILKFLYADDLSPIRFVRRCQGVFESSILGSFILFLFLFLIMGSNPKRSYSDLGFRSVIDS